MFLSILVTAVVSVFVGVVILGHILLITAAFHGNDGSAINHDRPADKSSRDAHDFPAKLAGAGR